MSYYNLESNVAIVTGASRGIGKEICSELLKSNCYVLGTYNSNDEAAKKCCDDFSSYGNRFFLKKSDASNEDDIKKNFTFVQEHWGLKANLLVNNAGILNQGPFDELKPSDWDQTLKVNLRGPFLFCQHFLKQTLSSGSIVNISSIGGQIGGDKAPDYAASKAALISLTKSIARLGAKKNIRSNAVAPGWIKTDIFDDHRLKELTEEAKHVIPLSRIGTSNEVAKAVVFLLSDDSSYITGHCLNINGGLYLG